MKINVLSCGRIDFNDALLLQQKVRAEVAAGGDHALILCEHPQVITLGRSSDQRHILLPENDLNKLGITCMVVDRGGDVTLHAPGQLILYPILDLNRLRRDIRWYIYKLEQVAIDLLKDFDILSDRSAGQTGVWIGASKIASIGIGIRQWVTYHGLAVNINTNLKLFKSIKPCGLDVQMTSLQETTGRAHDLAAVSTLLVEKFCAQFELNPIYKKEVRGKVCPN